MMAWETQDYFSKANPEFLLFVFAATMFTYFFHAIVNTVYAPESQRQVWNHSSRYVLWGLLVATGGLTLWSWWPFRQNPLPFIGVAIATFLYSAPNIPVKPFALLKRIAIGKTIYLAAVWTYVTSFLPLLAQHQPLNKAIWLFAAHRFLLILPICILFDRRDMPGDKARGVKSLATMTGEQVLKWVYFLSLMLSALAAIVLYGTLMNPLMIPVIIMLVQYPARNTIRHDAYYTLFLDGMMMCSAILHAIRAYGILQ